MSARLVRRHELALRLGLVGSAFGVIAGIAQATVGGSIPDWSGAKAAPVALGLLTVALSLLAGVAAFLQQRDDLAIGARAACAFGLVAPGLLCLSTVGRLWYLPAGFLLVAGALTVDGWRQTRTVLATNWLRVLVSALGVCELLMSAGAAPAIAIVGAVGGLALIAAAWTHNRYRTTIWALIIVGTVPFAASAWTAIVPLVLLLEATLLASFLPARRRTA